MMSMSKSRIEAILERTHFTVGSEITGMKEIPVMARSGLFRIGAAMALLLFAVGLFSAPARADIFRAAEFTLVNGQEATGFEFTASIPYTSDNGQTPVWPEGCTQTSMARHLIGTRVQYAYSFRCDHMLRATDRIQTPWQVDGASFISNVMGVQNSRSLTGGEEGVTIPVGNAFSGARPLAEIGYDYLAQGVLHIWMGWDHLAFVLCLCMIAGGRKLLGLITAFTIGHSVSLALAFFELVQIPVPPVEAIIALSIAFMAREALTLKEEDDRAFHRQMVIVVAFGLLHGLGFASALGELGVQSAERVPALIFFNLGVETGQVIFVGGIALLMAMLRSVSLATPVRAAAMYGVGIIGCFWMVERIIGFSVQA